MEINGIAHVMLTVSNFEACLAFYEQVLTFVGLKPVIKADGMLYCVGGRTAVGIMKAEDRYRYERPNSGVCLESPWDQGAWKTGRQTSAPARERSTLLQHRRPS